ncbi:hypothetical protein D3C78_1093450 [compost metagenome]
MVASAGATVACSVLSPSPTVKSSVGWSKVTPVIITIGGLGAATFTVVEALKLPSLVVTVIIAIPSPTGVTTPSTTVATVSSLELQITSVSVAFAGSIVAFSKASASPAVKSSVS